MERDGPPSLCNQVTTNLNGGVNFWWAFVGSVLWTDETVLTSGPYEETSIATDSSTHAAIIAATGFNPLSNGPVGFFSAVYGTGSWQGEVVSGTGTASSAPVINPDSVNGYNDVNISLVGPGGQVRFDFLGLPLWHLVRRGGPGQRHGREALTARPHPGPWRGPAPRHGPGPPSRSGPGPGGDAASARGCGSGW